LFSAIKDASGSQEMKEYIEIMKQTFLPDKTELYLSSWHSGYTSYSHGCKLYLVS